MSITQTGDTVTVFCPWWHFILLAAIIALLIVVL